jgi:hypothetical protein
MAIVTFRRKNPAFFELEIEDELDQDDELMVAECSGEYRADLYLTREAAEHIANVFGLLGKNRDGA